MIWLPINFNKNIKTSLRTFFLLRCKLVLFNKLFFDINNIYYTQRSSSLLCIIISDNLEYVVLCAAHRGRLNLLTGLLNFPPEILFRKLRGFSEFPATTKCTGDVISHLISSTELNIEQKSLYVTMVRNPSHLEIVNPISMGKTRGTMQLIEEAAYGNKNEQWSDKIINIQVSYMHSTIKKRYSKKMEKIGNLYIVLFRSYKFLLWASWFFNFEET